MCLKMGWRWLENKLCRCKEWELKYERSEVSKEDWRSEARDHTGWMEGMTGDDRSQERIVGGSSNLNKRVGRKEECQRCRNLDVTC